MLYRYIVVATNSSVKNGQDFNKVYSVDACSGLHAIVAFLRDTGGVSGGIAAYCVEGITEKIVYVKMVYEDLVVSTESGKIIGIEYTARVIQNSLPF